MLTSVHCKLRKNKTVRRMCLHTHEVNTIYKGVTAILIYSREAYVPVLCSTIRGEISAVSPAACVFTSWLLQSVSERLKEHTALYRTGVTLRRFIMR